MFSIQSNKVAHLYPTLSMEMFECYGDVFSYVAFWNVGRKINYPCEGSVIQKEMGHIWTVSSLLQVFTCSNFMQKLHENNIYLLYYSGLLYFRCVMLPICSVFVLCTTFQYPDFSFRLWYLCSIIPLSISSIWIKACCHIPLYIFAAYRCVQYSC